MRVTMISAAVGLMVLAGCEGSTEPAQPPTQEDALTTATVAPPTTSDEIEATTEAAPTTAEPSEEAGGVPELPEEATEPSAEGAEAFALHYLAMVNYTGQHPEEGLLEPLAAEGCASCDNHEEAVAYGVANGEYLLEDTFDLGSPNTIFTQDSARVAIPVSQLEQDFYRNGEPVDRKAEYAEATLVLRVQWDGAWTVSEITVEQ